MLELSDIERVRPAVEGISVRTPLFNSRILTESLGSLVVFKAENLQRTGSFKIRGAASKLAALGERARAGVVVASAGNHAQAVAFAAREAGVPCEVYMPAEASITKAEATTGYGAEVHLGGASLNDCLEHAVAVAAATGKVLVHPYDDEAIISGQGTLGLELVEDVPDLVTVVVPLGGGGLTAGVALAVKSLKPDVHVIAVQAANYAPWPASLARHEPLEVEGNPTLADGIAVSRPGDLTLPLVERYVDEVVTVGEDSIADAMVLLLERAKLVVEGAGAVGVAAMLAGHVNRPVRNGSTVIVLSGGNVDTGLLGRAIRRHETSVGRRLVLFARIPDRPGSLARLLTVVGEAGGNLVTVEHLRDGFELHVRETAVHVVLETRNPRHAQEVLDAARHAGFEISVVGHAFGLGLEGGTA